MNNVNQNKDSKIQIIRHFIKDLSYENPQDISENNIVNNNNNQMFDHLLLDYMLPHKV